MKSLSASLSRFFYKLGETVATNPRKIIVISLIVNLILGAGIYKLNFVSDVEYLYTQLDGENVLESNIASKYFLHQDDLTDTRRTTESKYWIRLVISDKDGGNVLTYDHFQEMKELRNFFFTETYEYKNGEHLGFEDVCGTYQGKCADENTIVNLADLFEDFRARNRTEPLSYPLVFNKITYEMTQLTYTLAGEELNEDGTAVYAGKAVFLFYRLRDDIPGKSKFWLDKMYESIGTQWARRKHIQVQSFTLSAVGNELEKNILSELQYLFPSCMISVVFIFISLLALDWTTAKPWVGMMGLFSALLGAISGIGFLCWLGFEFVAPTCSIPFLMLGIGQDDAFIMIAAWRRTNRKHSVTERTAETYANASHSITITTLTDALSFAVGIFAPYHAIRLYCLYACVSTFFVYGYQIFLLGSFMALSGEHEANGGHGLFLFHKAIPHSRPEKLSLFQRTFMMGAKDVSQNKLTDTVEGRYPVEDFLSSVMQNRYFQATCLLLYVAYLIFSLKGAMLLTTAFDMKKLFSSDSQISNFIRIEDMYSPPTHYVAYMMVTSPLDYSKKETQDNIFKILENIRSDDEGGIFELSGDWLTSYLLFLDYYKDIKNISSIDSEDFVRILKTEFFESFPLLASDVALDASKTTIVTTRYPGSIKNSKQHGESPKEYLPALIQKFRAFCKNMSETYKIEVVPYMFWSGQLEQSLHIGALSFQLLSLCCIITIFICAVFIPNLTVVLSTSYSVLSILLGLVGCLGYFRESIDPLTFTVLVANIGFSVDFAVHCAHAFVLYEGDPNLRIKNVLRLMFLPVFQGAVSSVIALFLCAFCDSYMYRLFFEAVTIVMIISAIHAIILVPMALHVISELKLSKIPILHKKKVYTLNEWYP